MTDRISVLVVDDDERFRERLAAALSRRGYDVRTADGPLTAEALATEEPPEAAVVDLRMPEGSGLNLIDTLLALDPHTRVVVLTGYGSVPTAIDAIRRGAVHYLQKPVDAKVLEAALRGAELSVPVEVDDTPTLARQEWEYIQRVLTACDDNISEAARRLGIHRRSLQRKLQKTPPRR